MDHNTSYNLSGTSDTNIQRKFLVDKCKINTIIKGKQKISVWWAVKNRWQENKSQERIQVFIGGTTAATFKLCSQRLVNIKQTTQYHNTKYRNVMFY